MKMGEEQIPLINSFDLYKLEQADEVLETGLPSLDALFGGIGGIPMGIFVEIVGLSSVGKSQFCMQLAVNLQKNDVKKECVYVDTEGGFQTKRICQIATRFIPSKPETEILKRIRISRCRDLVELMSTVYRLESLVQQNPNIGLIIVDSVAMPLRGETDYAIRSRLEISRILSKLAASYRLIVIAVNHVTYRFKNEKANEPHLASALGTSWSHRPSTRLWFCPPDASSPNSLIFLAKSSYTANGSVPFKITEGGLIEVEQNFVK